MAEFLKGYSTPINIEGMSVLEFYEELGKFIAAVREEGRADKLAALDAPLRVASWEASQPDDHPAIQQIMMNRWDSPFGNTFIGPPNGYPADSEKRPGVYQVLLESELN